MVRAQSAQRSGEVPKTQTGTDLQVRTNKTGIHPGHTQHHPVTAGEMPCSLCVRVCHWGIRDRSWDGQIKQFTF